MYRDATGRCQIGPLRFAVGGYPVSRVPRLLAQGVHLTSHRARSWKLSETEIEVEAQGFLVNQVDSAGNTTGSDQSFGWRETNRLR
jgi:hypothetical protein